MADDFIPYTFARGIYRAKLRVSYKDAFDNSSQKESDGYLFKEDGIDFRELLNFENYEDASSGRYAWEHSLAYDELTNTNTVTSRGETMSWERLQYTIPTTIGQTMKLSFEFCCPDGMIFDHSWGKLVMATSNKATSSTHEPSAFNKLGYVNITNNQASNEFVHYEFTFTPIAEETYIIFDFSSDRDYYTYVQKYRNIKLEIV